MSLEQTIANLQQQAGLLLDLPQQIATTATQQIDRVGNAYVTHINRLTERFYVSENGADTSSGLDTENPLKTIKKAVDLCPVGGIVDIVLMSNIHVANDVIIDGKTVNIISQGSTRHVLSFEHYEISSNSVEFSRLHSFMLQNGAIISVRNVRLNVPHSNDGFANNTYDVFSGIFKCSANAVQYGGFQSVSIIDSEISRPANSKVPIVGFNQSVCCSLSTRSVIQVDQPVAGFWFNGVAAGTDPNSVSNLLTTLPSL